MEKPNVSIYLDIRRKKTSGKYPAKLRVYHKNDERRLYDIKTDLTEEEYKNGYLPAKPRQEYRELKKTLTEIEAKADKIITSLKYFTFERFERKMFRLSTDSNNVIYYYDEYIKKLTQDNKIGTADSYTQSLNSILLFIEKTQGKKPTYLSFDEVTPAFLNRYEKWMTSKNRAMTTVGIYLRPLRALFNQAISEGEIEKEIYPFGKRKYQVPAGQRVKKALNKDDLRKFFYYPVEEGSSQQKARDFWFFIYQCNGMNIRDIADLKYENIQGDSLIFLRTKTMHTTKSDSKQIIVSLTADAKRIIAKYGNPNTSPKAYVFPIFSDGITEGKKSKSKNFTKVLNDNVKLIAKDAGINPNISSNWARHSYASNAIRGGASMEYIQESLGHKSIQTTMNYWAGFEESAKKAITDGLMDFTVAPAPKKKGQKK